jgi:excinuclease ABC subunit C
MKSLAFDGITSLDDLKALPETPGVYFFLDEGGKILYIGKATSLRDRVRSYFSQDLMETRGPKLVRMKDEARRVGWRGSDSVLEALILESRLIRELQPPYNTDAKDDKSYNHVVITDEAFPRVLLVRGRDLEEGKFADPIRSLFGPFPNGGQLREAVKIIRKLFPFRDTCEPFRDGTESTKHQNPITKQITNHKSQKQNRINNQKERGKPCFHRQIGLCPGVCTGEMTAREYGKTVRHIERFFRGEKGVILRSLKREMDRASVRLDFEQAGELRNRIFALEHIHDVALLGGDGYEQEGRVFGVRIEAYDVAHLGGDASVGVMTVYSDGSIDKDSYRKFRLRGEHAGDDLSALEEILRRRAKHSEWPSPDILVVDGGLLQKGVADRVIEGKKIFSSTRIVGVVKNRKHQPERLIGDDLAIADYRREILLVNAEAHRFAITYHRKRRGKEFLAGRSA